MRKLNKTRAAAELGNDHQIRIETGGKTQALVDTNGSAETVSVTDTHAADTKIVMIGVNLGLTAGDFHHSRRHTPREPPKERMIQFDLDLVAGDSVPSALLCLSSDVRVRPPRSYFDHRGHDFRPPLTTSNTAPCIMWNGR